MADQLSDWGLAIKAALEHNKAAGRKPDSWRGLSAALAALPDSTQTKDNWWSSLKTWRTKNRPEERNAKLIAEALGVPRSSLPETGRLTVQMVETDLRQVEEQLARETKSLRRDLNSAIRRIRALEKQSPPTEQQGTASA